jgi:hypothetical protein
MNKYIIFALTILSIAPLPTKSMVQPPEKTPVQGITYAWRKRIPLEQKFTGHMLTNKTRLILRTVRADWVNTHEPVILIFSIHSKFHEGASGEFKAKNLIAGIKENTKGTVVVLFPENAHTKADSLKYGGNEQIALDTSSKDARALAERLKPSLTGCAVHFWDTLISNDPEYAAAQKKVKELYAIDKQFQQLLREDAQGYYTAERALDLPDKELFITKTMEDIMEQIAYLFIVCNKGYKFEFYPGQPNSSSEYINHTYIKQENRIKRVPVFLHFE